MVQFFTKGSNKLENLGLLPTLVCISEADILKDRNLEFCAALAKDGKMSSLQRGRTYVSDSGSTPRYHKLEPIK